MQHTRAGVAGRAGTTGPDCRPPAGRQDSIDALLNLLQCLSITASTLRARLIGFRAAMARQVPERVWWLLETGKSRL